MKKSYKKNIKKSEKSACITSGFLLYYFSDRMDVRGC